MSPDFWKGKRVFITGHTGFKGPWLCRLLLRAGAELTGYALEPPTKPDLFSLAALTKRMTSVIGDILDQKKLHETYQAARPEIVIHMAAQSLVRASYADPSHTYQVNVQGTVNILECLRRTPGARSFLNVTTDKVYLNREWPWGYRETERLDGFDPYSNSKSCSELVTGSYKRSFLAERQVAVSTARSGNVIGGGDFAADRIIPDCVRAARNKEKIIVRNPHSTRPYQHVLEPLSAYLLICRRQFEDKTLAASYNVGPDERDCLSTGRLAELFCRKWGDGLSWEDQSDNGPHEAAFLKLDCSLIKSVLDWRPRWDIGTAVDKTAQWTRAYFHQADMAAIMDQQIEEFLTDGEKYGADSF